MTSHFSTEQCNFSIIYRPSTAQVVRHHPKFRSNLYLYHTIYIAIRLNTVEQSLVIKYLICRIHINNRYKYKFYLNFWWRRSSWAADGIIWYIFSFNTYKKCKVSVIVGLILFNIVLLLMLLLLFLLMLYLK